MIIPKIFICNPRDSLSSLEFTAGRCARRPIRAENTAQTRGQRKIPNNPYPLQETHPDKTHRPNRWLTPAILLVRFRVDKISEMIDTLESRVLFSAAAHSALASLRVDVGSIGHRVNAMIVANNSAIANLQNDLSVFPTAGSSDHLDLRVLNIQFRVKVAALANDYNDIKVLLGQDITQLIADTNAYDRTPAAAEGLVVQASEKQLTAQAAAASSTLAQDTNNLKYAYEQALAVVQASHPLDTTLVTRTTNIATALANNVYALQAVASTVALTDVANFITSLEPDGVITTA